jgi:hypothetical protein
MLDMIGGVTCVVLRMGTAMVGGGVEYSAWRWGKAD